MPDPALSGASLDLLLGLQNAQGEAAWKLFETLRDNGMTISGPNAQALTPVLQGAKAAVFGAVDYVSYASVERRVGEGDLPGRRHRHRAAPHDDPQDRAPARRGAQVRRLRLVRGRPARRGGRLADAGAPGRGGQAPLVQDLALLPEAQGASSASRAEVLARFARIFGQ